METHVFGWASSPSCSNYALRRTAKDMAKKPQKFWKEVFLLISMVQEVVNAMKQLQELCSTGDFNLKILLATNKK